MVEDMIQLLNKIDKLDITKKRGERYLMIEHESIILTQTCCCCDRVVYVFPYLSQVGPGPSSAKAIRPTPQ
jgi:hypothetical protein